MLGRDGSFYGTRSDGFGVSFTGSVFRLGNPAPCASGLALSYRAGTLNIGFTLKTSTPATWSVWIAALGGILPLLSSFPLPAISPAFFVDVAWPSFPPVGQVFIITTLNTGTGVWLDWKMVHTR